MKWFIETTMQATSLYFIFYINNYKGMSSENP